MALATVRAMSNTYNPMLLAPPGPVHVEARRVGVMSYPFASGRDLLVLLRALLVAHRTLAFMATAMMHSLVMLGWNALYRHNVAHIHVVHGGADETKSYGRKRWLNRTSIAIVAVSAFVKERLAAHGVQEHRVSVIENFLPLSSSGVRPQRKIFIRPGVERALVISRLDPIKRVDLLLDALNRAPELRALQVRILGSGWDAEALRSRAALAHPNVTFVGFSENVEQELAAADLLVHLCPVEPFGLSLLEAMAARVPVLTPDTGGAAALVEEGVSGFHFRANDAAALAARLRELRVAPAEQLNAVVAGGMLALTTRFAETERIADYQQLLTAQFSRAIKEKA